MTKIEKEEQTEEYKEKIRIRNTAFSLLRIFKPRTRDKKDDDKKS